MKHIIRKQILDIGIGKKQNPFQVQQHMSRYYHERILPALNKIFDELSEADEVITIEQLSIDAGTLDMELIMTGREHQGIYELLLRKVREAVSKQQQQAVNKLKGGAFAQWLFYMEHGYLNWNLQKTDDAWHLKVLETLATDFASMTALRRLLISDAAALQRIVLQHDEDFLLKLVEILTAEKQPSLSDIIAEILAILNSGDIVSDRTRKLLLWKKVLRLSAISPKQTPVIDTILSDWITSETAVIWFRHSTKTAPGGLLTKYIHSKFPDILTGNPDEEPKHDDQRIIQKSIESDEGEINPDAEPVEEDEIFLPFAGIVLLHPFLSTFFKKTGLAADAEFKDDEARYQAMYLLYYMASGSLKPLEYELAMPKILVNYPLHRPVPRDVFINDDTLAEANGLLEIVIAKWDILKNTSVSGLREGFLQRDGKYYRKNDQYHLHVESASIDMLLDHLPWNINYIKLPWMKHLLKVEWR